jgi:hypothetical protein
MESMLGISLYSYLYLKLAKTLSSLLSLMFSLQQNQRTRGWNGGGVGVVAQTMYIHVSKCKNDKIKRKNNKKKKWVLSMFIDSIMLHAYINYFHPSIFLIIYQE